VPTGTPGATEHGVLRRYGVALGPMVDGPWEAIRLAARSPPEFVEQPGGEPPLLLHCSALFDVRFSVRLQGTSLGVLLYHSSSRVVRILRHHCLFQSLAQLGRHIATGGAPSDAPAVFDAAEKTSGGGVQQREERGSQDKDGRKEWRTSAPPLRLVHVMNTVYDHDLTGWIKQHLRVQSALSFHTLCSGEVSNRQARNLIESLSHQVDNPENAMRGQHRSQDLEISFALGGGGAHLYDPGDFYGFILDAALGVCEERSIKVAGLRPVFTFYAYIALTITTFPV